MSGFDRERKSVILRAYLNNVGERTTAIETTFKDGSSFACLIDTVGMFSFGYPNEVLDAVRALKPGESTPYPAKSS